MLLHVIDEHTKQGGDSQHITYRVIPVFSKPSSRIIARDSKSCRRELMALPT